MREIIAAIDLETTGLNPLKHDIIELAIVPLTADFREDADLTPFTARIRALHPETAEPEALAVNKLNPADGDAPEKVMENFRLWCADYGIARIEPLGHNLDFDLQFLFYRFPELKKVFGASRSRDTQRLAVVFNDLSMMENGIRAFAHVSLAALRTAFGICDPQTHRALDDARDTVRVYRAMLGRITVNWEN